jgi:hypothetical protein
MIIKYERKNVSARAFALCYSLQNFLVISQYFGNQKCLHCDFFYDRGDFPKACNITIKYLWHKIPGKSLELLLAAT